MPEPVRSPHFSDPLVYPAAEKDQWFDSPFLAPRGICAVDDWLFLSDTAQNQVFCWRTDADGMPIDDSLIFLKGDTIGTTTASSLQYPSGIWSDGKKLVIADAWNHRVLIWHTMPTACHQPADTIIGQTDPAGAEINRSGEINSPRADSLYWPYGVHSDGKSLWIADTGNRRILHYATIPEKHGASADLVLGQPDFKIRDHNSRFFPWPYSVKIGPNGQMIVSDPSTFRINYWQNWRNAGNLDHEPTCVLGQRNAADGLQNLGGFSASAESMNWCYDAYFFKRGIIVADTGNSRLLEWLTVPTKNATPADFVLGQDSFNASAESSSLFHQKKDNFYWPFSISLTPSFLWVADTGNNRIVRYRVNKS
ncbi:MAG: hypothetical protein L3J39_07000 [Verrucomicrobiales bacterium]|nr:hypothetical protein [Verrucomicrobiales bacterium]